MCTIVGVMKETVLEELGFNKNEAKVYLALIELGSTTATEIAKKSGVHRTNVYDSLNGLLKKGIVAYIQKEETKYYEATNPENLMNILKEKEIHLKELLPQLKLASQLSKPKGEAQILEGTSAFMDILYGFLEYNEPIYVFGIPKIAPETLKTKLPHFHAERIKRKIKMICMYNYDAQERVEYYKSLEHSDAGYIDDNFKSMVSTNICGPEVVLSLWTTPVHIIRIKNAEIANAYKHYFELLWANRKK